MNRVENTHYSHSLKEGFIPVEQPKMFLYFFFIHFLKSITSRSSRYIQEVYTSVHHNRTSGSKGVAFTLHSTRGPLPHLFVTGTITESQRHRRQDVQPAGCGAAELSAGGRLSKRARLHQTVARIPSFDPTAHSTPNFILCASRFQSII